MTIISDGRAQTCPSTHNFVCDDVKATLTDHWVKREQRKFGMKG